MIACSLGSVCVRYYLPWPSNCCFQKRHCFVASGLQIPESIGTFCLLSVKSDQKLCSLALLLTHRISERRALFRAGIPGSVCTQACRRNFISKAVWCLVFINNAGQLLGIWAASMSIAAFSYRMSSGNLKTSAPGTCCWSIDDA